MLYPAPHPSPALVSMASPGPGRSAAVSAPLDVATIEAARTGDRPAWSVVVRRYHTVVLAIFLGYAIARPRAAELTQDVWLKLYLRARDGLLKVLALPGLPIREARFRAIDELRSTRRAGVVAPIEDVVVQAPSPTAEEQASRQSELALVRRMVQALPKRQREVLALSGIEGLPHARVAERLGISTVRARQTLSDARVRLRRMRAMPDDVQQAYLSVVVDGWSTDAVAQRMDRPRSDVEALLRTAKQHIASGGSR